MTDERLAEIKRLADKLSAWPGGSLGTSNPFVASAAALRDAVAEIEALRAKLEVTVASHPFRDVEPSIHPETGDSIVDRLRGIYTIPIRDGAGPIDGKVTFTRRFGVGALSHEAADEIERLKAELESVRPVPKQGSLIDGVARLREIAGGAYDNLHADAFMAEVRGEDDDGGDD